MGKVEPMVSESSDDWYEAIISAQPEGPGLSEKNRDTFNDAFDYFTSGSYDMAYTGFSELASQGSSICQYYLGVMYASGMGVLQDFGQAHMWLNIASSQGHKKARRQLEKLTHHMTADQIADAQKRARQWVSKHSKGENHPKSEQPEPEGNLA
ncbi:MAG: hypothetical protein OES20_18230 [Gammaproteobacteria bacterium]|nr:hypothetical protein [Gammaproteobacteria bacterium]